MACRTTDGACTGKPVARLRPNQTSLKSLSSGSKVKTDIPIHEGKWIDVKPKQYDAYSYNVSKKMIKLLRHELLELREEDGAIAYKSLAQMFVSQFESSPHWSIQIWLNHLERRGGPKKRFQYCVNPDFPEVLLSLQPFMVTQEETRLILLCKTSWYCQMNSQSTGSFTNLHSTVRSGLIAGGKDAKKGRQAVVFTAVNPMESEDQLQKEFSTRKLHREKDLRSVTQDRTLLFSLLPFLNFASRRR